MSMTGASVLHHLHRFILCVAVAAVLPTLSACDGFVPGEPYHPMGVQRVGDRYELVSPVCEGKPSQIREIQAYVLGPDDSEEELWRMEADRTTDVVYEWPSLFRVEYGREVEGMITVTSAHQEDLERPELRVHILTVDDIWVSGDIHVSSLKDGEIMSFGKIVDMAWLYRQACSFGPPPGIR